MKHLFGKKGGNDAPRRRLGDESRVRQRQTEDQAKNIFRRNRTLVGSLSMSVSSSGELNTDHLRSPRAHIHHLSAHRRRLGSILVMVVAATTFLVWLLYEFTASVSVSPTNSGIVIQSERYQQAIISYMQSRPLERLRFALNEEQLSTYLKQQVPEVLDAHVNGASGFATSHFDISFRQPIASWLIGSQQYYVDKNGESFRVNYFDSPTVKIIDESGIPQTAGTAIASSRFLQFVGRVVDTAKTRGMTVEEAIIPAGSTRQINIKINGHAYPIKLSLDRPVGEQVEDMQRAVAYLDSKGIVPEYVDVRVSGKAYYK